MLKNSTNSVKAQNILSRLNRIEILTGNNVKKEWLKGLICDIGISKNKLYKQYNTNDILDIISINNEYYNYAESLICYLEFQNGIYQSNLRVKEIQKPENKYYYIEKYSNADFDTWLNDKFKQCADQCHCSIKEAADIIYKAFIRRISKTATSLSKDKQIEINVKSLINYEIDKEKIMGDVYIKRYFICTVIACLFGI